MKTRGCLIAGNWKMNHGLKDVEHFFDVVRSSWGEKLSLRTREAFGRGTLHAITFAPFLGITTAIKAAEGLPIKIGAQNVHWEKKGAFTGEVSGVMLHEIGVTDALVGHSERRQYFGETNETVRKRTDSLLAQGFRVITCIGETRTEREAGMTEKVLITQLDGAFPDEKQGAGQYLKQAGNHYDGRLVIAYEPVWAIGTGLTATPEQAEEAHRMIRKYLTERFGKDSAEQMLILYGGSVTPENVVTLLACPNIDGALVGGASLKPESFLALIEAGGKSLAS